MEIGIAVYHLVKQIIFQRMLMLVRKTGEEKFIYLKVSAPIIGSFLYGQVKEQYNEGLFHNFWV